MTERGRSLGVAAAVAALALVVGAALWLAARPPGPPTDDTPATGGAKDATAQPDDGGDTSADAVGDGGGRDGGLVGELVVAGAASAATTLEEVAALFEHRHPDLDVVVNLGGSATLAEQVRGGAPVDVLLSASREVVDDLATDDLVQSFEVVATNELRVAVPRDPVGTVGEVDELGDLVGEPLVGLCAAGQPCGDYARAALEQAGIDPTDVVDTAEPDAGALLRRLASGELDAAVVYASDLVVASGDVVDTGMAVNGPAIDYVAAVLAAAPSPDAAAAFVRLLLDEEGQQALLDDGFGPAP